MDRALVALAALLGFGLAFLMCGAFYVDAHVSEHTCKPQSGPARYVISYRENATRAAPVCRKCASRLPWAVAACVCMTVALSAFAVLGYMAFDD